MAKIDKNDKALFVATGSYGISIITALLATRYVLAGFVTLILFSITVRNIKRLWLYSLPNKPFNNLKKRLS